MLKRLRMVTGMLMAVTLLLGSPPAQAGHDAALEIQFWAFSRDSKAMLVVVKDTMRGITTLAIKATGTFGVSIYEVELPPDIQPAQLPAYLAYPPFNQYGFVDAGVMGEAAPDGSGTIMASKLGREFQLFFARGEQMKKMFGVPLGISPDGLQIADGRIKEVRWASTGRAAAIILHQTLTGDYGVDTDQLISFDPTPYKAALGPVAPPPGAAKGKK